MSHRSPASNSGFGRSARRVKKINLSPKVSRGGIRL